MSRRLYTACLGCWLTCLLVQADGGFLPPKDYSGKDLKEPCQRAILVHRENWESLVLFVDYEGEAKEFAWIIPTPTKPRFGISDKALFQEIATYFRSLQVAAGGKQMGGSMGMGGGMGGGDGGAEQERVVVHAWKLVGPYEVAVLTAEGEDALLGWLARHEYRVTGDARGILTQYIREKWYFVVAKIRTTDRDRQSIRPLRVDFATREPVYPLRISALNAGFTDIRIYALRDDPQASRSVKEDPYGDTFRLRRGFGRSCPLLARAFPDLRWERLALSRISTVLPPQVMGQSDDRLHAVANTAAAGGGFRTVLVPRVSPAATVGTALALISARPEEREWAWKSLSRLDTAQLNSWQMVPHAEALSRLSEQQSRTLRKQLFAMLRGVREKGHGGKPKHRYCGAMKLLAHLPPLDDPETIAYLEASVPDMFLGWTAYDQLHGLGTATSRQALFRLASLRRDFSAGVAYRYVGSLAKNEVPEQEQRLACGQLWFLQAEGITRGIVIEQANKLLREYTEQDFGKNWKAWEVWLKEHRPEYWERKK